MILSLCLCNQGLNNLQVDTAHKVKSYYHTNSFGNLLQKSKASKKYFEIFITCKRYKPLWVLYTIVVETFLDFH